MRIIDKTGRNTGPYLSVLDAKYIDDYRLLITFNEGISRIVDFGEFLRASPHPDIKKYLDVKHFKAFHIEYGDLMWGDFDMIFPVATLHRGGTIQYTPPKINRVSAKSANRKPALKNGSTTPKDRTACKRMKIKYDTGHNGQSAGGPNVENADSEMVDEAGKK